MDPEDVAELQEEVAALRRQVLQLSDNVADGRARALHLEATVAHLRRQLLEARRSDHGSSQPSETARRSDGAQG